MSVQKMLLTKQLFLLRNCNRRRNYDADLIIKSIEIRIVQKHPDRPNCNYNLHNFKYCYLGNGFVSKEYVVYESNTFFGALFKLYYSRIIHILDAMGIYMSLLKK